MLCKIRQWLQRPTVNQEFLSDLLFSKQGKEEFLGVAPLRLPTAESVLGDAQRVLAYANSSDYQVWAKEAWSQVLADMDKLLNPKSTQEEINFCRGSISRALDLLRISHQVRLREPMLRKQADSLTRGKTGVASNRP